jgi:hypothetical protein
VRVKAPDVRHGDRMLTTWEARVTQLREPLNLQGSRSMVAARCRRHLVDFALAISRALMMQGLDSPVIYTRHHSGVTWTLIWMHYLASN